MMRSGYTAKLALMAALLMVLSLATALHADAAVTTLNTWRTLYDATAAATTVTITTTATATVSAGTNRLLVVGVCMELGTAGTMNTMNVRLTNAAGAQFTLAGQSSGSFREHCYMGYHRNANIPTGNYPIYVNATATQNITAVTIQSATYEGVDQTTPETDCESNNSGGTTVTFAPANNINYQAGSITTYVAVNGGTAATISDNATPAFTTRVTSQTAQHSMYARDVANATAGSYPFNTTITFAGTTANRSAVVVMAMIPAVTDTTPPVAGAVTISPDGNLYTSASPTITQAFTDNETAVTICRYTTNNGGSFADGVVSGTLPNFTCTGNPTGLSGSLTGIYMSAVSSGGTTTASGSAITRTVDATAPANGTLNGTPGNQQVTLNWSGFTDAGIGLHPTAAYTIRWAQSATAPANCTAGTLLGTFDPGTLSTVHGSLTNGLPYSYRICATDLAGNQNTGVVAQNIIPQLSPREVLGQSLNTAIAASPQNDTASGVVMQRFQVTSAASPQGAGDNQLVLSTLTLDDIGTATQVTSAEVWIATTSSATLPGTAVMIGSTGGIWSATTYTIPLNQGTAADRTVTTGTPKYIYIVYDMMPGQATFTVQSSVKGIGVSAPDDGLTGLTLNSNLITLQPGPKVTITSCGDCHGNPPRDGTTRNVPAGLYPGSHNRHAGTYNYACTNCHVDNTGNFAHQNGRVQTLNPIQGLSGNYLKGSGTWTQDVDTSFARCQNVYCHSSGTGGTLNAGDPRGVASNTSPTWFQGNGTTNCSTCHGTGGDGSGQPNYVNGTTKANSHATHLPWNTTKSCQICHNATTTTSTRITGYQQHGDRTYDLAPDATFPTVTFSYTYVSNGGTCANAACHGGRTPKWGTMGYDTGGRTPSGDWDCISCHSYSFPKRLGGLGTIRQVVGTGGDFASASRHLLGASTIIKWDCIVCHREGWHTTPGVTAGAVNWQLHNNTGGVVNLRDVDNPTSGWAIDNRAWTTTDYTNLDQFCLNCHDANGASGINVNSTNNGLSMGNARALTPFNTTDTANGIVAGSTTVGSFTRTAVINLKDKFFAGTGVGAAYNGNPSQHAVIGKRYSTVWAAWGQQAWGSTYRLKKDGRLMNVARETAILSCADCHVIDAGAAGNAHGADTPYMMWTTHQVNMCWRCHNQAVYQAANGGTSIVGSRIDHSQIDGGQTGSYTAYGLQGSLSNLSWPCLHCHANWEGFSTVTRNASYGGIHGSWRTTASWYTTSAGAAGIRTAYRFAPGTNFKITPASDTAWGSGGTISCYFYAPGDSFATCTRHGGTSSGSAGAAEYGRPPKY